MHSASRMSTGIEGLDEVINGLRMGDNVVWQVDQIEDYKPLAVAFAEASLQEGERVIYLHFANHEEILTETQYIKRYNLDPNQGFEAFSSQIHQVIRSEGEGIFYVFDCLSNLQPSWSSDLMIGNFFMITCPYLLEMNTITYFALLRNSVSFSTVASIRDTTQVLIDVYNIENNYYFHLLKVLNRYSTTMFFPHLAKGNIFTPITSSVDAARLIIHIQKEGIQSTIRSLDFWDRNFLNVEDIMRRNDNEEEKAATVHHLCRIIIGRDERMLMLAMKYLTLEDFLQLKDRLIGTGFVGGKAAGMILARKILSRSGALDWDRLQEPHDSFYIGSDVFYTYIVRNGWWKLFMEHKTDERFFEAAAELHEKMLTGSFPTAIKEKIQQIIEYYGQSPIIVRSSSLLEDAFGNAFAGKYESYFLVNQGTPGERYTAFIDAVRKIFASTMNEDALTYRVQRGLNHQDEQMALLVQRVSGTHYLKYYFPYMAGVGLSRNTHVWNRTMDQRAGMIRLVFGLGTRAVNRVEGDYPRIVPLDQPLLKPLAGTHDLKKYSQHFVDVLNVSDNVLQSKPLHELLEENSEVEISRIAIRDMEAEEMIRSRGDETNGLWILNFDGFLSQTGFAADMRTMLQTLEEAYQYPVDIEFTVNFSSEGRYNINLLQCRPQQTKGEQAPVDIPKGVETDRIFFRTRGNFLGGNISQAVKRVIIIDPHQYALLPVDRKYDVARIVGKLNKLIKDRDELPTVLMGPGRWGTSTPSLGIPVRFSEINKIKILVEIASPDEDLMPEFSYGTHFFQDLVETDIFYIALFPEENGSFYNRSWPARFKDIFSTLLQDEPAYAGIVSVYDVDPPLRILSDIVNQDCLCFE